MDKIKVGITHGDCNGIGYEVILKTLSDQRILELCTPVLYGSMQVVKYYKEVLKLDFHTPIAVVSGAAEAEEGQINLVEVEGLGLNLQVQMGLLSKEAGVAAAKALWQAREDLLSEEIDAVVTAPINKDSIQSDLFRFTGHTEFFSEPFRESHTPTMLFVAGEMRVALVTMHLSLQEVSAHITKEHLRETILQLEQVLKQDFALQKPRIAVLGLNPHAGEGGLLGQEEKEQIQPAVEELWQEGHFIFGPYPADGFFGSGAYMHYDATLAMYHDQGLIPFKLLAMEEGVNITAGLPIIRTSPDHGTAYDITGKGVANETSFRNALYRALDIYRARKLYKEATKDPLTAHYTDRGRDREESR